MEKLIWILLLPFWGTILGAAGVFIPGLGKCSGIGRFLTGFAAGVMVAASIWSLILPAIEQSGGSFLPALTGVWLGFLVLLGLDHGTGHLHPESHDADGKVMRLPKTTMLTLSVTLHNFPEGLAVGVAAAGWLLGDGNLSYASLLALSIGIALQNIPEGAIISMPLHAEGMGKGKAFFIGAASGAVEPVAALLAVVLASFVMPVLPCFLCFAAGAMLYVVVKDLIPEMCAGTQSDVGVLAFCSGFTVMMVLDVALG